MSTEPSRKCSTTDTNLGRLNGAGSGEEVLGRSADGMFLNAGFGGQPQQAVETPLMPRDSNAIRAQLSKWYAGRCKEFIDKLLTEAGKRGGDLPVSTDVVKLFDLVASQQGFVIAANERGTGYSTVSGAVGAAGGAKVFLSATSDVYSSSTRILYHAYNALAELTHVAGSKPSYYAEGAFSDVNLARVSYDVASSMGVKFLPPPTVNPAVDASGAGMYSRYYHESAIKAFCPRK